MKKLNQHGFTIIELLIATIISSIMILSILTVFIQITRYFTKGTTQINTQKATRIAVDNIIQKIQTTTGNIAFQDPDAGPVPIPIKVGNQRLICINRSRYSYDDDSLPAAQELDAVESWKRTLYVEEDMGTDMGVDVATCKGSGTRAFYYNEASKIRGTATDPAKNLLGDNMSVVRLDFLAADGLGNQTPSSKNNSRLYEVGLTVLNAPPDAKTANIIDTTSGPTPICRGSSVRGTEYCGLSTIDTTIFRLNRVVN